MWKKSFRAFMASASNKLLQKDQAEAAQQQAQKEAQDPLNIIQKKELQLKEQELMHKMEMDKAELQIKSKTSMGNIELQRERINSEDQREAARINVRVAETEANNQRQAIDAAMSLAEKLGQ
jgi:hypothetical protein